jgi:predicted amidohydrolase
MKVEENLAVAQQLAFEAAAKGARVIVLPELCTSGLNFASLREAAQAAQAKDGYQTIAMAEVSKRFGCHVVFGFPEIAGDKLYNSAVVVGPTGQVEGLARKHNLYGPDNVWAQPDEGMHPVVVTDAGRLGVLICRDISNRFRESYRFHQPGQRFYRRGSVDTIAAVTNWGGGYAYPDSDWVELCEETGANVIVSNRVGEERDMQFKGGTCIIDRHRRIYTYGSNFDADAVVGGMVEV